VNSKLDASLAIENVWKVVRKEFQWDVKIMSADQAGYYGQRWIR